jgi:hypothetical protein
MTGMDRTNTGETSHLKRSIALLAMATAMLSISLNAPAIARDLDKCSPGLRGAVVDDCVVVTKEIGKNTEQGKPEDAAVPFKITVDGETLAGSDTATDAQRRTDVGLDSVDIQVKFDGLDAKQILSVNAEPVEAASGAVRFRTSTNYARFIKKGEVRVFRSGNTDATRIVETDPVAIVNVNSSDLVEWKSETGNLKDYYYVYRVYDEDGRFDETRLKPVIDRAVELDVTKASTDLTGDQANVRNISVYGGAVTVFGRNIPQGYDVNVFGKKVTADSSNQILFQQILPPGDQDVEIAVAGGKGSDLQFTRQINIPKNDWFYVALADFTLARRLGTIEAANPGEFERTYTKGRLAFYLKGKIKGKYLLTAAADTEEGEIKDIFRNLDRKDPRSLLRRLDPDDYYPIYGDDSTITQDAPTSGKAYVRLERGQSHVMWGNFKTTINGTEFARVERGLYGAHGIYKSEAVTSFGESKVKVEGFAAQPGTVPQRDVFDPTGGSAYFLSRQDINKGSEQVIIEVVTNGGSGIVTSRKTLVQGTDYTFDYVQGVIILTSPLAGNGATGNLVVGGGTAGDVSRLVVNYEITPTIGDQNGLTAAARGEGWLGDHVRIGATASQETIATEKNSKIEADVVLRATDKTNVTLEVAQSEGRGIGQSFSSNGGTDFIQQAPVGARGQKALAYRVKAASDLGEISGGKLKGNADAYYEFREAGFSAVSNETAKDTKVFGANVELNITDDLIARIGAEGSDAGATDQKYRISAEFEADIAENWKLAAGVTWTSLSDTAKVLSDGDRTDVGVKLTHQVDEDTQLFVFGQATINRTGNRLANNRAGVGGETMLTDKFGIAGDVSYGNTGIGASAKLTYKRDENTSYYLGYKLDADRDVYADKSKPLIGSDTGVIVVGANTKLNDWTSAFTEANVDLFGKSRTIGQVYGLTFTPDETWSTSLGMSLGSVTNPYGDDFDRKLFLARAAYTGERLKVSLNGEVRLENDEDDRKDITTYLVQANANWKSDGNWRILASLDAVLSKSNQANILDGDYIEASIGSSYRPIDNDKLNVLFKYTYLYDLPGAQQVNANNVLGPSQRSHVLSIDATYDLNEWLSIGGKYGYRFGEQSVTRKAVDFKSSSVHLGIVRADVHVVKNWDLLLEGRVLHGEEAKQTKYGALAAGYRHFGDNLKVGVGYNFGNFSDDMTDLIHDDQGVFLNVIGKF